MAQIEWYAAESVYDPPSHAQGVKVTGTQTILFIAGQVAFDEQGGPTGRDFAAQAREVHRSVQAQVAIAALGRPEWLIEVEAIAVL